MLRLPRRAELQCPGKTSSSTGPGEAVVSGVISFPQLFPLATNMRLTYMLPSSTSEIESMMTSTKNELRQSRVELMAAKEEVRASRGEITHLKQQLAEARVTEKRQTAEIQVSLSLAIFSLWM